MAVKDRVLVPKEETAIADPNKKIDHGTTVKGKLVELGFPVEIIGNKKSISSREAEIFVYDWGIKMISKKTKRTIRIYAANIKACEEI